MLSSTVSAMSSALCPVASLAAPTRVAPRSSAWRRNTPQKVQLLRVPISRTAAGGRQPPGRWGGANPGACHRGHSRQLWAQALDPGGSQGSGSRSLRKHAKGRASGLPLAPRPPGHPPILAPQYPGGGPSQPSALVHPRASPITPGPTRCHQLSCTHQSRPWSSHRDPCRRRRGGGSDTAPHCASRCRENRPGIR